MSSIAHTAPVPAVPPSPAPTMQSFRRGDDAPKMRDVGRDTPAAPRATSTAKRDLGRKKSRGAGYYGEVFSVRETEPKVPKTAGIIAELRTNVILEDEFSFASSLSSFLAQRYARPESSVCLSLTHSACMITGGTFDGTYLLSLTSPVSISPTCNKRNAALLAEWFATHLGVAPSRGFVKFVAPDHADLACGGHTVLDLMERDERARIGTAEKTENLRRESVKRSLSRAKSRRDVAPGIGAGAAKGNGNGTGITLEDVDEYAEKHAQPPPRLKRKSMFNLFSRG